MRQRLRRRGSAIVDERGSWAERLTAALPVDQPALWSAETPELYRLTIALLNPQGEVLEVEACDVGFRRVDISNGLLKLNGKPLLIRGVNRHEHHPENGQVMDEATMRRDIEIMKQHNFNAVRCSHYLTIRCGIGFATDTGCTSLMKPISKRTAWCR